MFDFVLLLSAILLIAIDFVYLGLIRSHFSKQIQAVQGSPMKINYLGVAICYIFLIVGLNYFIIKPRKSVSDAFLLGLIIYGVYETTNYALLSNWSLLTVIIDTLWGGVLFASTTYLVHFIR
ncbi:MAG: DUF2177 family protein [Flavobacterium sp.]